MDLRNLDDGNVNSKTVNADHIDNNNKNHNSLNYTHSRTKFANTTHCKINKDVYTSTSSEKKCIKSTPISISLNSNSVHLTRSSDHKNIYNTETYITCDGQQANVPVVDSQTQDVQSSLEAFYLPHSIENLDTASFPRDSSNDDLIKSNEKAFIVNNKKQYTEKSTYCRPIFNLYNQEFIFKTMEENAKLQRTIRRLIEDKQCESRRNDWNNFINDLRNKHYNDDDNNRIPECRTEAVSSYIIQNYYNKKNDWDQSAPYKNLLHDFYSSRDNYARNNNNNDNIQRILNANPYIFRNNLYCYPTSSQGRLQMLNKEKIGAKYTSELPNTPTRYYRGNTNVIDRENPKTSNVGSYSLRKYTAEKAVDVNLKNELVRNVSIASMQNGLNMHQGGKTKDSFEDKLNTNTKNLGLKKNIPKSEDKNESLINIENKLNHLINTINSVLLEIKTNKAQPRSSIGVSCKFIDEGHLSTVKGDIFGLESPLRICKCPQNVAKSTVAFADVNHTKMQCDTNLFRFNEILNEEMDKSKKIKEDIERILSKEPEKQCSVQVTFDLPTKEQSTEVTASLSKAKVNLDNGELFEEIPRPSEKRMTIAVNTDPLGLLALLRVSTETVKKMLSSMPNIDYYSYLSMFQPQSRSTVSHYICNICGAAFIRPSQLSDHIQEHNLGKTRDCCLCRHVLDSKRQSQGLFSCNYCGQRFTRAYCCELHQQSCAKTIGAKHDVNSDLSLLT